MPILRRSATARRQRRLSLTLGVLLVTCTAAPAAAPASIVWTWSGGRSTELSGVGCGQAVSATVDARAGAFDLRTTAGIGRPARDAATGEVVARLRITQPVPDTGGGIPGLRFVFVGSDDACEHPERYVNGWDTEPVTLPLTYLRREQVYFKEYAFAGNGYVRERPASIHGGSDFGWTAIRWSSWGGRSASGRGAFYYVDKSGTRHRRILYPMLFKLTNPQPCYGRLRYLRMETVRTTRKPAGVPHRQVTNLTCASGIYGDA